MITGSQVRGARGLLNWSQDTFVIFNKAMLASKSQDYFLPRWQQARPLTTETKGKKSSRQKP
jgi:hypothetical protein